MMQSKWAQKTMENLKMPTNSVFTTFRGTLTKTKKKKISIS